MSNLLTGVAPQAGLVAQSSSQTAANATRNAQGNAAQMQVVQRLVSSGAMSTPAVVVSIGDKARAASYGEGRGVDAGFEKQAKDGQVGENGKDGKRSKTTVDVTA